jgi:tetratricopeptide (TPR) repeat protein
MDIFSSASIIFIVISAFLGLILELIYTLVVKKESISWQRLIITPTIFALVGFYAEKIAEIDPKLNENSELLNNYVTVHNSSIEYLSAIESLNKLEKQSPLRFVLQEELQFIKEKLKQIEQYELMLRREEVIPKWESLIENSNNEILATNIVSLDDWKKFSPTEGEEKHRKALAKKVGIKRIFIFNGGNDKGYKNLLEKAKEQAKWGVDVRLLNGEWISESPFVSDLLRDIETMDIVIYDKESVLLTNVDRDDKIISATLTNNQLKLKKAQLFFEKLWNESKKIPK